VTAEISRLHERGPSDDFEKLLAIAEELHDKNDLVMRRIETYRLTQLVLVIPGIAGVVLLWIFRGHGDALQSVLLVGMVIVELLYAAMFELIIRRNQRRTHPDQAALKHILALVRETEPAVSRAEKRSALDRAQFQIRLSRLEVDPQTR